VLAAALGLAACSPLPAAPPPAPGTALQWGVFEPGSTDALSGVVARTSHPLDLAMRFSAVDRPVPIDALTAIAERGAMPVLTLEPWDPAAGETQADWDLASIVDGRHDDAFRRWAQALAAWNRPVLLRFAHEMNSYWYPWAAQAPGNSPARYVAAWRHVHRIFDAAHADRVRWVWAPNVPQHRVRSLAAYYPGAKWVDVLGIDGYNSGRLMDGWRSPAELFGSGLDQLRALPGRHPIVITETASSEGVRSGVDKSRWIRALIPYLMRQSQVTGIIWFDEAKEHDWRLNSTRAAEEAIRAALAPLHRRR
jgi:hypothetical protein